MKLNIHSLPECNQEELRTLLIDAADQLAGKNPHLLEAKLPWDGHPIFMANAQGQPILVSFDTHNSQAALLNGLNAVAQLTVALAWVNTVYKELQQLKTMPKLIVVSRELPPGADSVLSDCGNLSIYTYKILRINTDTGLWLERLKQNPDLDQPLQHTPETLAEPEPELKPAPNVQALETLPGLSEEERTYFKQL